MGDAAAVFVPAHNLTRGVHAERNRLPGTGNIEGGEAAVAKQERLTLSARVGVGSHDIARGADAAYVQHGLLSARVIQGAALALAYEPYVSYPAGILPVPDHIARVVDPLGGRECGARVLDHTEAPKLRDCLRLSPQQSGPLVKRYTEDPEVYTLYLKRRFQANRRTLESVRRGLEFHEQALARDRRYAPAHAGLADAYNLLGTYSILPPGEAFPKARQAAQQALAIDDTLAEAHAELATVEASYEWIPAGAAAELRRAIELNPAYAPAHQAYAEYLSLLGRHKDALRAQARFRALTKQAGLN